jgi:hypothetical protein
MLATWDDSWFEEGVRVFYILSERDAEALLPLSIDPPPSERIRVLVARVEILTPEMETAVEERLSDRSDAPLPGGRFAEPLLLRVLNRTADPRVRTRIRRLVDR